ncbi:unnamed protein product [Auanema sp. JU1783]|nr:unnamed protein product [Auanema sp. JU1783]
MGLTFGWGTTIPKSSLVRCSVKTVRLQSFSTSSNYLIASSVRDERYRQAVALGITILSPTILSIISEATTADQIVDETHRHHLPRFKGVLIYLHLDETLHENRQIRNEIMTNGGLVVSNMTQATHIIVNPAEQNLPDVAENQFLVSSQWIHVSRDLNWCADEQQFILKKYRIRRGTARRRLTFTGYIRGQGHCRDSATKYKRYQLCQELYSSEIRCLQMMDFLVRISTDNYLTNEHNLIIFGSFLSMKTIHSELVEKIGRILNTWDDDSMIGNIFVEIAGDMERSYLEYFQHLEICQETFKECKHRNSRFRSFIEVKEQDRSLDKQKIEYLFSIPYQQLTSRILVTLKAIHEKTDKTSSDYICLLAAIEAVDQILRKCNDSKKKTTESRLILKQIKNLPAYVICSRGIFLEQHTFRCVLPEKENKLSQLIQFYLFDDSLIIARRLNQASCVTLSLTKTKESKKTDFNDFYPLSGIREVCLLSDGPSKAFVLTLRNVQDTQWYLDVIDSLEDSIQFMNKLVDHVNKICNNRQLELSSDSSTNEVYKREWLERSDSYRARSPARTLSSISNSIRRTLSFNSKNHSRRRERSMIDCKSAPSISYPPDVHLSWEDDNCENNELVNPYDGIKHFTPYPNISKRERSILDDCC